jgi:ribosomal-protein-alanine N-acetyltransferase
MTPTLVPLDQAHAALLAAMHRICFSEAWDETAMAGLLAMPGSFGFLALAATGEPAGFILCRAAADEGEVLAMLVLPPWRRQGVARNLVATACSTARRLGAAAAFLEVASTNDAGQALYASLGFRQIGRRLRYYGGGADALVLRLDLAS